MVITNINYYTSDEQYARGSNWNSVYEDNTYD